MFVYFYEMRQFKTVTKKIGGRKSFTLLIIVMMHAFSNMTVFCMLSFDLFFFLDIRLLVYFKMPVLMAYP